VPQINRKPPRTAVVECPECEWTKTVPTAKAEQSLVGHIGYAHRQGQGTARTTKTERTNRRGERVMNYGRTKRSRENSLRLTDGQEHPVATRRIDSQPDCRPPVAPLPAVAIEEPLPKSPRGPRFQ
jgi:hypothetical protein